MFVAPSQQHDLSVPHLAYNVSVSTEMESIAPGYIGGCSLAERQFTSLNCLISSIDLYAVECSSLCTAIRQNSVLVLLFILTSYNVG